VRWRLDGRWTGYASALALYAVAPPLVAHAVLVYPGRRLTSWLDRLVLAAAYVGSILLLGLGPALVLDPAAGVCTPRCRLAHCCRRSCVLGTGSKQ